MVVVVVGAADCAGAVVDVADVAGAVVEVGVDGSVGVVLVGELGEITDVSTVHCA